MPADDVLSHRAGRVAAARRLTRPANRRESNRFLAEGANAVTAALDAPGVVHDLLVTEDAARRHDDLLAAARATGVAVGVVTQRAAELLSETVTPQGIVAVCDTLTVPVGDALAGRPRLVATLVDVSDPGNAGTVIRVADAAGADAVILAGQTVDPHNGKCVRASAGSLFHLPIARVGDAAQLPTELRAAGLRVLAADGTADASVDDLPPEPDPTAWLFGSEAHGLPDAVRRAADRVLRVPIYGAAESLNLATASAVCLYASARAQRVSGPR